MDLTEAKALELNKALSGALDRQDWAITRDLLQQLQSADASNKLKVLGTTKLSKTVFKLSKASDTATADAAAELVQKWRQLLKPAEKVGEKRPREQSPPPPQVKHEAAKPEPAAEAPAPPAPSGSGHSSGGVGGGSGSASGGSGGGVLAKTGEPTRDMVRAKLRDAFAKGISDNVKLLRELDVDPCSLAAECEEAMAAKFGGVGKDYQARFRSLIFNLKDPKNPEFSRAVVLGQLHVGSLCEMDVKEMASAEVKKQRHDWSEHAKMALMDEQTYNQGKWKMIRGPKGKPKKTSYLWGPTRPAKNPTTKKALVTNW
ncbi:hypothetical protein EMIHUDRAFT_460442, partial [Emiliania huxleyi CCMP1516]|uniref:TFIIS central domain-containing protein n=2 Tax=Emiliania huxleyi TaxID=2903 RepID=A0A0D3KSH5_EMIH1